MEGVGAVRVDHEEALVDGALDASDRLHARFHVLRRLPLETREIGRKVLEMSASAARNFERRAARRRVHQLQQFVKDGLAVAQRGRVMIAVTTHHGRK